MILNTQVQREEKSINLNKENINIKLEIIRINLIQIQI